MFTSPHGLQGYAANRKASARCTLPASASPAYCAERIKEMIKFKGFGIAPAELEAVLLEHPEVREAAVIGWPDAEGGEIPRAYVAVHGDATVSDDELMAFVNAKVANYKAVRQVVFVESIPKTASGKILRRQLKEQA